MLDQLLDAYVWFAISIARAARALCKSALLFLVLVLGAPAVASIIAVPLVSAAIAASPLSLRFVLGTELRTAITERMFAE